MIRTGLYDNHLNQGNREGKLDHRRRVWCLMIAYEGKSCSTHAYPARPRRLSLMSDVTILMLVTRCSFPCLLACLPRDPDVRRGIGRGQHRFQCHSGLS